PLLPERLRGRRGVCRLRWVGTARFLRLPVLSERVHRGLPVMNSLSRGAGAIRRRVLQSARCNERRRAIMLCSALRRSAAAMLALAANASAQPEYEVTFLGLLPDTF